MRAGVPSPGDSAEPAQQLLDWYRKIREPLKALYSVEDEVALHRLGTGALARRARARSSNKP